MEARDRLSIEIPNSGRASGSRTWPVTIVDSAASGHFALTLDLQGQVHLSYWKNRETSKEQLSYAHQAGNEWSQEVVTTVQGAQTAISITNDGRPLIAYFDLDSAQLMLARKSANGWQTESITPNEVDFLTSFAPGALCLAIDGQDQPVITYFNKDALKLARPQDGGWGIKTLAAGAGAGFFHDLALDSQGNPVIAYHLLGKQELHWLHWVDNGFKDEVIDTTPSSGEYVSVALDANDQVHLCCWRATGLIYLTKSMNGGEWQSEQVDSESGNQGLGLYCKIGVSRTGIPKIAYYDGHNGCLKFAHSDQAGTWVKDTVDDGGGPTGDAGGYIAMKLNELGLAQIAYYDWGTQEIKFTQEPAPVGQGCLWLLMPLLKWFISFRGWKLPRSKRAL